MIVKIKEVDPYKTGKRWENIVLFEDTLITKLNLGNGTCFDILACDSLNGFFLGIERKGCYTFHSGSFYFHPNYIAEKLNLLQGDADNIADWLNAQFNCKTEEFGHYIDNLCIDREQEEIERIIKEAMEEARTVGNEEEE